MVTYWIILLAIAVGVVFIAEKLKQPYPTFLVVIGLIIGLVPIPALGEIKVMQPMIPCFKRPLFSSSYQLC